MASFDPYSRIVDWLAANLPDDMKDDLRSFLRDLTLEQHNAERADNGLPPETHEEVQARLESLYGGSLQSTLESHLPNQEDQP